jgi:5-(carboxyamino)imidazole ribonucleotide mutase
LIFIFNLNNGGAKLNTQTQDVLIIAGSKKSDEKIINESGILKILETINISHALSYASAHRNQDELKAYVEEKILHGSKLLIGAAGMSAALPGDLAAKVKFRVPVIGVPLIASDAFDGLDALFSMIRMPAGVPLIIAGVGKPGLINAALIAAQIFSIFDDNIKKNLDKYLIDNHKEPKFDDVIFNGR